jgi:hypothetical protein
MVPIRAERPGDHHCFGDQVSTVSFRCTATGLIVLVVDGKTPVRDHTE